MPSVGDNFIFNQDQTLYLKLEKLSATRALAIYADSGDGGYLTAAIIDNNGVQLASTEKRLMATTVTSLDVKRVSDTKAVIVFDNVSNGNKATVMIINISGDVITTYMPLVISTGIVSYISVAIYDTQYILVSYRDASATDRGRTKLLEINADDTLVERSSLLFTTVPTSLTIAENSDSTNVVLVYRNDTDQYSYASLVRRTGTSISIISTTFVEAIMELYHNMTRITADRFVVAYRDEVGPGYARYRFVTRSGNVLTTSEEFTVTENISYFIDVDVISENKIIIAYCSAENNYAAAYKVITFSSDVVTSTIESSVVLDTGTAYFLNVVNMGNDNYLVSLAEDYASGAVITLGLNTPPSVPSISIDGGTLSFDPGSYVYLSNITSPVFTLAATDVDNDPLLYKIRIVSSSDSLVYESAYQSSGIFTIDGLEFETNYKVMGYAKDTSNAEAMSLIGYFSLEVSFGASQFWFEETPIILHDCENVNNVSGNSESLVTKEGFNKQGNSCIAYTITTATNRRNIIFTFNTIAIDILKDTLRFWYNFAFPIKLKTMALGGVTVIFTDTYNATRTYYIAGFDNYKGGWKLMQLSDWDNPNLSSGATMRWNLIKSITIQTNVTSSTAEDNIWIDFMTLGSSYKVVSEGPVNFDLIAQKDAQEGWGIFTKECGGVYQLSGTMYLGNVNSARGVNIVEKGEVVVTSDETRVKDNHHNIIVQKNASNPSSITFGEISNNKGINGVYFLSNKNKANFIIEDSTRVNLFGCNFNKYNSILGYLNTLLSNNTEFYDTGLINIKSGILINSVLSKSKLFVNSLDYTLANNIFKDNYIGIEYDIPSNVISDILDCTFIHNTYDLANIYTDYSVTINSRGISNPFTKLRNIIILSTKTLTLTDIKPGSEVRLYTLSKDELIGEESVPGDFLTYNYSYTGDVPIYIIVHHRYFKWLKILHTLSSYDESIQVHQEQDRNYLA